MELDISSYDCESLIDCHFWPHIVYPSDNNPKFYVSLKGLRLAFETTGDAELVAKRILDRIKLDKKRDKQNKLNETIQQIKVNKDA